MNEARTPNSMECFALTHAQPANCGWKNKDRFMFAVTVSVCVSSDGGGFL